MGCRKLLLLFCIVLYASVHVRASRSTTSGPSLRVAASRRGDAAAESANVRKVLNEGNGPRLLWQISQKLLARQMGSKPPNCQDKCNYCAPCEAVEVPISNREVQKVKELAASQQHVNTELADPDDTNYMPESWRCACGDEYYNP